MFCEERVYIICISLCRTGIGERCYFISGDEESSVNDKEKSKVHESLCIVVQYLTPYTCACVCCGAHTE